MKYNLFFSFLMILGSFVFTEQGEIVNVQAAQYTDGSGTVEIQYTLLPDETFPSFTVVPYILYPAHSLDLVVNVDGNLDVYLSTGATEMQHMSLRFFESNDWVEDYWNVICIPECGEIDNVIFSDELIDFETDLNSQEYGYGMEYNVSFGCPPELYPNCPAIPAFTDDVLLFTLEMPNPEGCMPGCGTQVTPDTHIPSNCYEMIDGMQYECEDVIIGRNYYQVPMLGQSYIEVLSGGLGENVFPGTYTFYWHIEGGGAMDDLSPGSSWEMGEMFENIKIRIVATSQINDDELPFEMVTIPSGQFYASEPIYNQDQFPIDYMTELRTIDYNYEIMKYEITYSEIVTWALQNEDISTSDLYHLGQGFQHINFDGSTLTIDDDYENFPASFSGLSDHHVSNLFSYYHDQCESENPYENYCVGPMKKFLDYYGLRLPNRYEWEYAARGPGSNSYFPWSNTTMGSCGGNYPECIAPLNISDGVYSCDPSCFADAFCIDGEFPFSMEGIYEPGAYENASPFGVYDMIGNVADLFLDCPAGLGNCLQPYYGAKGFDSYNFCNFENYSEPPTSCEYTNSMDCQETITDAIAQLNDGNFNMYSQVFWSVLPASCEANINSCSSEITQDGTWNMFSPYADYPHYSFPLRYVGLRLVRTISD